MTVLVTAASRHGSTAEIARVIAGELIERGVPAAVVAPDDVRDLAGYDAVVVGSAVYTGHWLPEALALVDRCSWGAVPVWLFSSGPVGDPGRSLVQKMGADPIDVPKVRAATGAREHRVFAGKLVGKHLSFGQRAALVVMRGLEGDWRDWDAVRAWAAGIAEAVQPADRGA